MSLSTRGWHGKEFPSVPAVHVPNAGVFCLATPSGAKWRGPLPACAASRLGALMIEDPSDDEEFWLLRSLNTHPNV
jgi:hypothetical protein